MAMAIARILFAALIALSVASLPVASAAVPEPAEMSMSDGDHDCCPNATQPCDTTKDGCMSMMTCGLYSSTLSETSILEFTFPPIAIGPVPLLAAEVLHSRTSGPPLHPPQV